MRNKNIHRQTNAEVFWEYSTLVKAFAKAMELIHIFAQLKKLFAKILYISKKDSNDVLNNDFIILK